MSDTSYVIDVAADFDSASTTSAQLDEITAALIEAGAGATDFESAAMQVAKQLSVATEASRAANDALAEGNARYGELEKAAINAAKAAERAGVKNGGVIPPDLLEQARATASALESYGVTLKDLEHDAAKAAAAEAKLADTQGNLKKLTASANSHLGDQEAAIRKSVKEAEGFVPAAKTLGDFSDAMSTSEGQAILAAGAVSAAAAAIAAVTAAAVAGTIAIASWAVGLADANRSAALTSQAATIMQPELAGLADTFAAISDETGAGSADLRNWTKQLEDAKVSADQIPDALRAVALASASGLGQEGVQDLVGRLRDAKGAASDVAAEVSGQLAPVVEQQMRGLDAQTARFHRNISDLFGGLNIDPVLEGFRVLVGLFDKNSAAGQAMHEIFNGIFQPLIDQAQNAAYVVEAFVLGFLIGLTKLYIAVKPAIRAVKEFFGFNDSTLADTLDIAKVAGEVLAGAVVALGVAFVGVAAAVAVAVAPFAAVSAAVYALVGAVTYGVLWVGGKFVEAWHEATAFLESIDLGEIGANIIQGLANGISGAADAVIGAITGVAHSAIDAAKSVLHINSPSKVFAEIGGFTGEGFVQGIDGMAGEAYDAMAAMVAPPEPGTLSAYDALAPSAGGEPAAGAGAARAGGGKVVNFNAPVYFGGKQATQAEVDDLAERLTKILEGDATAIAGEAAA